LARLAAANSTHRYIQLVRNWRALNSNATRASPLSLRAAHRSAAALETATQVHVAIAGLREDDRKVFTWHHDDKLTFAEIARRLTLSSDSVERAFKRALAQLKRRLAVSNKAEG
jgi:RNA polymerase sigma factor (sigma-70 family)